MPAQAGIQYAAALVGALSRSGILGPRLRGDDAQCCVTPSRGDAHGKRLVALHEAREDAMGLLHHLDGVVALQDLLPDDSELQFRQAEAHAAVDAEAERQVRARPL